MLQSVLICGIIKYTMSGSISELAIIDENVVIADGAKGLGPVIVGKIL